jgi:hypothetical protein
MSTGKKGSKPVTYKISDLHESSPILKEVSKSNGRLSAKMLEQLLNIRQAIVSKKKQSSETLEKIIFKKT